ncbi:hypothetical protein GCM10027578_07160 [Spirosoma luteolum]
MKLNSTTGSFELSIVGYATQAANWRERNNLRCRISTMWRQQHDSQAAPLQTWEVRRLLTELRSLWSKAANRVALTFAEPGLAVEGVALPDDQYRLQIQLDRAMTPAWHPYPDFPLELDMLLSRNQLQEAIQDLSGQLESYPER